MYMEQFEDKVTPMQLTVEFMEAVSVFPALHKYKKEHNTVNLQKLCAEISEFCRAIYASTQNDAERQVYYEMLLKLNK